MKSVINLFRKLIISVVVCFVATTNLPIAIYATEEEPVVETQAEQQTEEVQQEEEIVQEVVEQEQVEQEEVVEETNVLDNQENKQEEQITEEQDTQEIDNKEEVTEIIEETKQEELTEEQQTENTEEVIEEATEEVVEEETRPTLMMMSLPLLTGTSTPTYTVAYGETSEEYILKDKANANSVLYIQSSNYDSNYCSVETGQNSKLNYIFKIKGTKITNSTSVTINYKGKKDGDYFSKDYSYTFNVKVVAKTIPTAITTYSESSPAQYSGSLITNSVVVKDGDKTLTSSDYTVEGTTSATEPGTYSFKVKGKGNYTGEKTYSWKISANLENANVSTKESEYYYTGYEITPEVVVKWNGNNIDSSKYNVTYNGDRVNVGQYSITITAKDGSGYTGSKTINFSISKIKDDDGVTITKNTLTYDGSNKELVNVDKNIGNRTIYYYQSSYGFDTREGLKLASNGKWSTSVPTGKDAGTYHVYWKADGNNNCETIDVYVSNHIEVKISQKSIVGLTTVNKSDTGYDYTGNKQKVSLNTSLTEGDDYSLSGTYEATEPDTYTFYVNGKGNYTGTDTKTWKINQSKDLSKATITLSKTELPYNANQQAPTITNVTIGGETVNSSNYDANITKGKDVGEYSVTISASTTGTTKGYIGQKSTTYKIVKGTKVASVNGVSSLKYTGNSLNLVTPNNPGNQNIYYFVSEEDYSSNVYLNAAILAGGGWSSNIPTKKDAGTYYVYWYAEENNNCEKIDHYHDRYAMVTISKVGLDDSGISVVCNYAGEDGTEKSAKDYLVVKYNGNTLTSKDITIQDIKKTEAGSYYTKITATTNGNFTGERTGEFVIATKNNEHTGGGAKTLTYNGSNQILIDAITPTYGTPEYKLENGSWSTSIPSAKIPGDYTVYYRVQSGSHEGTNYNAIYGSTKVTIKKKPISDSTITFKQTSSNTFKGYSQAVIYELKDTQTGNTLTLVTDYVATDGSTGKSAGNHTIKFSGSGIYYTGTREETWIIEAIDISNANITITSLDLVYDTSEQSVDFVVTHNLTDLKYGEDYTIKDNSNKATNAGTHTLTIEGTGDYKGTKTKEFTIYQSPILVGGNPISVANSAYSANGFTYDGSSHDSVTIKSNITGLQDSENKEVLFRVNEGEWQSTIPQIKNAGIYKIGYKIVTKSGKTSNYKDFGNVVADPIIVTVLPKKLEQSDFTIKIKDFDPATATAVFTGKKITAEIVSNCDAEAGTDYNIINSSDLEKTEPGTYTILLTTLASNSGNFTNEAFNLNYSWTIEKKDIDGTFDVSFDKALYTGSAISVKDYVNTIKYGDVVLTKDDYEINNSYTNKGTYSVTISGKGSRFKGSHTFTNVFEIVDADLQVTADLYSGKYDAQSHNLLSNVVVKTKENSSVVSGMTIKYSVDGGQTWSASIPQGKDVKDYTIKYRVFEGKDSNSVYHVGCIGEFTLDDKIAPATIDSIVISGDKEFTYDAKEKSVSFTVKAGSLELASTDYEFVGYCKATNVASVELASITNNNLKKYASNDKYYFTVTGKGNFKGSKDSDTWTIKPADVSDVIVLQNINPTYFDGQEHEIDIVSVSKGLRLLTKDSDYTVTCTKQVNASSNHQATIKGKGNYTGTKTVYWTIEKANILVNGHKVTHDNQPIEKTKTLFVYNSNKQQLVKLKDSLTVTGAAMSPLVDGGEDVPYIEYRLGLDGEWTRDISKMNVTDAGVYMVYYRMSGDGNHNDYGNTVPDFIEVTVQKAKVTALNFDVALSNDMIEEGDVTYDALLGVHTPYNALEVTATLTGTYKYPDPENPSKLKEYTLVEGTDYIVYDALTTRSATNVGNYAYHISTAGCKNFEDIGVVVVKPWSIDLATPKINVTKNERTYDMHEEDLFSLNEKSETDKKGPSNIDGYEDTVWFLISDKELTKPKDETGWVKYGSEGYLEDIKQKDAGTYYVYYGAPGTPNYKEVNDYFTVTIDKYDITDKDLIKLTGYSQTEKIDKQGNYEILTQEFKVEVDHTKLATDSPEDIESKKYVEVVTIDESEINSYLSTIEAPAIADTQLVNAEAKSNQGTKTGKYTLSITLAVDHSNYKGSASKIWGINGLNVDNEEQEDQYVGDYTIKNNVVDEQGDVVEGEVVAQIETKDYKILEAIATSEDLSEIANGNKLNIILNSKIVESSVAEAANQAIKNDIQEEAPNFTIGAYIDISLFKEIIEIDGSTGDEIGTSGLIPVHETAPNKYITVTVPVDESLINEDNSVDRIYKIVRVHNKAAEGDEPDYEYDTLDATFDATNKTLTFSTNKFSTYAVVYKDQAKQSESESDKKDTYHNEYEWSDDYKTCKATRVIDGTSDVVAEETVASLIEVKEQTETEAGYVTYTAVFEYVEFEKQQVVFKIENNNYPFIKYDEGTSKLEGSAQLVNGRLYSYVVLVVNKSDLDTSKLSIENEVKNYKDVMPIEMHLEDGKGNIVESTKGNKYGINFNVPKSLSKADEYVIAKVNEDGTITIVESKYDAENNKLSLTVEELGDYVIITSKEDVKVVDNIDNNESEHSHVGAIVVLVLAVMMTILFICLNKKCLGYISIAFSLIAGSFILFKLKCKICIIPSIMMFINSIVAFVVSKIRNK